MPYTRKTHKRNIRSYTKKADTTESTITKLKPNEQNPTRDTLTWHNPVAELRKIAFISIPLLIALGVGTYLESTTHWVAPFAKLLLGLGS